MNSLSNAELIEEIDKAILNIFWMKFENFEY